MEIKKLTINGKTYEYHISRGDAISVEVTKQDSEKKTIEVLSSVWDHEKKELIFHAGEKVYQASVFRPSQALRDKHVERNLLVSFSHSLETFSVAFVTKKKKRAKKDSVLPATKVNSNVPSPDSNAFTSPLAGMVTKVLVSVGDQVQKGQPLLLIESMKMENELCADRSAFIKTIFISQGNVVQQNHVLLEFENTRGESDAGTQGTHEKKSVQNRRPS